MSKQTLLQKARAVPVKGPSTPVTKEMVELSIAWMKDEISYVQANKALTKNIGSNGYITLARGLKEAYKLGLIK